MLTNNTIEDLITGIYRFGPDILDKCLCDNLIQVKDYHDIIEKENLLYPKIKEKIDINNWFIPNSYKNLDIESFLYQICPEKNQSRLELELKLYKKHSMVEVLKLMKYIVDILRQNNIVWGVGRGSSVASYTLFLLGVHKIDSVKYNLPIEEFFKGETNG